MALCREINDTHTLFSTRLLTARISSRADSAGARGTMQALLDQSQSERQRASVLDALFELTGEAQWAKQALALWMPIVEKYQIASDRAHVAELRKKLAAVD